MLDAARTMTAAGPRRRQRSPYIGWWASVIFLAVTFVAAATVWFMFHPL